jgi:uncharacterized protein YndB with AHSA1/START domain
VSGTSEQILVRAPVGLVYVTLTDVDGWSSWWHGCRSRRAPAPAATATATQDGSGGHGAPGGDHHRLVIGGRWRRRIQDVRAHSWRHDAGMRLDLLDRRGHPTGAAEWWLEPCEEGTLVHHILHEGDGSRRQRAYSRAVRSGLQDLKDHLELAVAIALGRVP